MYLNNHYYPLPDGVLVLIHLPPTRHPLPGEFSFQRLELTDDGVIQAYASARSQHPVQLSVHQAMEVLLDSLQYLDSQRNRLERQLERNGLTPDV